MSSVVISDGVRLPSFDDEDYTNTHECANLTVIIESASTDITELYCTHRIIFVRIIIYIRKARIIRFRRDNLVRRYLMLPFLIARARVYYLFALSQTN